MPIMTDIEAQWLESLADACDPNPPWTPSKLKLRQARDEYICNLYEKGVAVGDIADKAKLSTHGVVAVIKKVRANGRDVVRPRAKAQKRESFRRDLTDIEVANLKRLDELVPRQRSGRRFLYCEAGEALLAEMVRLRNDKVALQPLADLLGVSRQAVHYMTKDEMWGSP
jgi:predicted DNA-binding protein YlxM (UPF0122 family)